MMRAATFALILLSIGFGCSPQKVEPRDAHSKSVVSLSTNTIRVGELVTADVFIPHATNMRVELPNLQRDPEIVIHSMKKHPQENPPGTHLLFELTSWAPSNHVVFTNTLRLIAPDGAAVTQILPFATLDVQTVLQETNSAKLVVQEFREWSDPRVRRAIWVTGLILLLVFAAAWYFMARRRRRIAAAPPTPIPPHETAFRRLSELRARNYITNGLVEPFYVELSDIVRRYIEDRFGLHAPEQTTDEFIRDAASSRLLSYDQQRWVEAFLVQSDLVKFARYQPGAPEMEAAWSAAEQLVRQTIPLFKVGGAQGP